MKTSSATFNFLFFFFFFWDVYYLLETRCLRTFFYLKLIRHRGLLIISGLVINLFIACFVICCILASGMEIAIAYMPDVYWIVWAIQTPGVTHVIVAYDPPRVPATAAAVSAVTVKAVAAAAAECDEVPSLIVSVEMI
jgi:hypothetical protein